MPDSLHSRAGYARLARELGGYFHPWQRELGGPDPELTFDVMLTSLLTPQTRVLEAGCGHGLDAARFGPDSAGWAAYDFVPEMLERARKNAPHAQFFEWNGKTGVPEGMQGPFDLIVSRRGPTSAILRLNELAAPDARFLYVGPRLEVPQVPERLAAVNWAILSEWRVSVQAFAPTWEDWQTRGAFMGEAAHRADWDRCATAKGLPYREERYIVLAGRSG
ncbi:class I SAM-dependent methyltransferase [Deinococcus cavernae]|uniref:Class I SAM-dependent methyltransferase n=1 Tax=Deinococcus cavernae TaxID=2320857 RepID=A0A418V700_9DEIO|nr:class I SAM-dependent methyltransferase [Deinococcus cavernae]RJF71840.1 class I SAM-dependent methyltransferase [Deinococcus cavernae]